MKIIVPIIEFYDIFYKNYISETIVKGFNTKESLLFNKIRKGEILTDRQAATLLYDGNPSGQAYSKMKQNFIDKLLKIVITYDSKSQSKNAKRVISLQNDFHAYRLLTINNINKAAINLAKRILLQAERLNQYSIGFEVARDLSEHFSNYEKNKRMADKYWEKYEALRLAYENKNIVGKSYSDLLLLTKKKNYNETLAREANKTIARLQPLIDKDNLRLMQMYFQVKYLSYAAISEHQGVIENNKEAISYFQNHRNVNYSAIDTATIQLIIAYLGKGQYDKAAEYLNVETSESTDYRWFNKISLKIRIYFTLQKYEEANTLMDILFSSVRFKQTETPFQEQMWLYKYYNDLMMAFIKGSKVNTRKIRNNMTRIASDKQGYNVALLIAETILKIQQQGIKSIYSQEDTLRTYIKSHLSSTHNDRAKIFIRFLLQLPNSIYDIDKFNDQYRVTKEAFQENPAAITIKPDNEVIPYEDLVHIIMKKYVSKEAQEKESISGTSASSDI